MTERQIPGGPFVNETGTDQQQIPGGPFLNGQGGAALSFEQEGFRWRYDDGDEDGATFSAAQDEHSAAAIGIKKRLRTIVNVTGTPSTEEFELQYRRVGSPSEDWRKVN